MDYIVLGIIGLIMALAIIYVVKEKKKGTKCIGCSSASTCASKKDDDKGSSCNCK